MERHARLRAPRVALPLFVVLLASLLAVPSALASRGSLYADGMHLSIGTIEAPDGRIWASDHNGGFCRLSEPSEDGPGTIDHPRSPDRVGIDTATCLGGLLAGAAPGPDAAGAPSLIDPSPAFPNSGDELAFVPDESAPSNEVFRIRWNPDTRLFENAEAIHIGPERVRPTRSAVGPDGKLYVISIRESIVRRLENPAAPNPADVVENAVVNATTGPKGPAGLAVGGTPSAPVVYTAELSGIRRAVANSLLPPTSEPLFDFGVELPTAESVSAIAYDGAARTIYAGTDTAVANELAAPGTGAGADRLHRLFVTAAGARDAARTGDGSTGDGPAVDINFASNFTMVGGVNVGSGGSIFVTDDEALILPDEPLGTGKVYKLGLPRARVVSGPTTGPVPAESPGRESGAFTNDSTPGFTVAGDGDVRCKLIRTDVDPDAVVAAPASCGTAGVDGEIAYTAPPLVDGAYRLVVQATDAGVTGLADVQRFTVDTASPAETRVDKPTEGQTTPQSPYVELGSNEAGARFQCKLDGAASWSACATGHPYAGRFTADAAHVLVVRSVDGAGNVGPEVTRNFNVDGTPPAVTTGFAPEAGKNATGPTGTPPTHRTNDPTPTITYSAGEPVTFACRADDDPYVLCPSSSGTAGERTFSFAPGATEGEHRFRVQARDANGNLGPVDERRVVIDLTGPASFVQLPAEGSTVRPRPRVVLSSSEPPNLDRFECRLDAGAWALCDPADAKNGDFDLSLRDPATGAILRNGAGNTLPLANGPHTLDVRSVDDVGNVGEVRARAFNVDANPPVVTVGPPRPNVAGQTGATSRFTFTVNEGATFRCAVDGEPLAACGTPTGTPNEFSHTVTVSTTGTHTFTVQGTDAVGNVGAAVSRVFTAADVTAPTVTIASPAENGETRGVGAVDFTINDANPPAAARCQLDGGPVQDCAPGATTLEGLNGGAVLTTGSHTLRIRATDVYGNDGAWHTRNWVVSSGGPGGVGDPLPVPGAEPEPVVDPPVIDPFPVPAVSDLLGGGLVVALTVPDGATLVQLQITAPITGGAARTAAARRRVLGTVWVRTNGRTDFRARIRNRRLLRKLRPGVRYQLVVRAGTSRAQLGKPARRSFRVRRSRR